MVMSQPLGFRRRRMLFGLVAAGLAVFLIARSTAQVGPRPDPAAAAPTATAPATEPVEPPPPVVVTIVYNIRDLIIDIPNFTDAPDLVSDNLKREAEPNSGGRSGTGWRSEYLRTREQRVEDLAKLIEETVSPDSWRENGGMFGGLKELDGQLIVTQTPENHRLLRDLLDQLRSTQHVNVRIRAHWVLTDRADLDKVLKPLASNRGGSRSATQPATRPAVLSLAAAPVSGRRGGALLAALPKDLESLAGAVTHYRAEIVCLNGQRVSLTAVRNQTGAGKAGAVVTPDVAMLEPSAKPLLSGLVLDVQQTMNEDQSGSLMTIRGQWKDAKLEPGAAGMATYKTTAATKPATGGSTTEAETKLPADRRDGRSHEILTSLWVPTGQMVLVGGMTVEPVPPPAGQPGKPPPQLYLFVEVTAD